MPDRPARAALYARVSTVAHGQDVALQLDELRAVATQRGWRIAGEYADEGVSGRRERRPGLDRLMSDARRGRFDVVAVWRFDRFARSTRHLLQALEEFRTLQVEFVSLREAVDTSTPLGRAMFTIVAAVAELEREIIRERVLAGVARARAKGHRPGPVPRVVIDPEALAALLAGGVSVREAARRLDAPLTTVRRLAKGVGQIPVAEPVQDSLREQPENRPSTQGQSR